MAKFTIEVSTMHVRTVGGQSVVLDWNKCPESVIRDILEGGAKTVLNNTFNGGGAEATDATKLVALEAKIEAWYAGNYALSGGGPRDSFNGDARQAYYIEQGAMTVTAQSAIDKKIKARVAAIYGDKETATFNRFLDATATVIVRGRKVKEADFASEFDTIRNKLQTKYEAKVAELRKETEAALADIDAEGMLD